MSEWPFSQAAVVAHRGDSAHVAENTVEAFESAIELGAEVVEFDVRMTSDGVAVAWPPPSGDTRAPSTSQG